MSRQLPDFAKARGRANSISDVRKTERLLSLTLHHMSRIHVQAMDISSKLVRTEWLSASAASGYGPRHAPNVGVVRRSEFLRNGAMTHSPKESSLIWLREFFDDCGLGVMN